MRERYWMILIAAVMAIAGVGVGHELGARDGRAREERADEKVELADRAMVLAHRSLDEAAALRDSVYAILRRGQSRVPRPVIVEVEVEPDG